MDFAFPWCGVSTRADVTSKQAPEGSPSVPTSAVTEGTMPTQALCSCGRRYRAGVAAEEGTRAARAEIWCRMRAPGTQLLGPMAE